MPSDTLTLPHAHLSPEARVLGETLVATINGHVQRYPGMTWADVRAVLQVLERAAMAEMEQDDGGNVTRAG